MAGECLEENEIVDLVTGGLDAEAARQAEAHIDDCAACRLVLIELARVFELKASSLPEAHPEDDEGATDDADVPMLLQPAAMMRGTTIGRYLVLEVLGAGAMGVVYAAFDPELDRKVALKLLRARASASSERLVREARATARLAHPNVVVVHDVGEHAGAVFMAMEFVEGGTLGEWLQAEPRDPEEVLEAFHEAGLGLQAAHAAGLVHRDFKPANVLMGRDGRARVTDFGLARGDGAKETAEELLATHPGAEARLMDATFTRTGALVGTPAYMSPEQFAGRVADARSDQFSFCVALFEALCGARPFAGKTVTELAANVSAGRIAEPKRLDALPRRVRTALRRGLQVEADDRYPTMAALLRSLQPTGLGTTSTTTRVMFVAGLALAGGGLGLAISAAKHEQTDAQRCEDGVEALRAQWPDARARAIETELAGDGEPFETRTAARVRQGLDTFADAWTEARSEVCSAPSDPVTQSFALRCLDDSFVHFHALVDALEAGDAEALQHAVHAVTQLDDPARCTKPDWRQRTGVVEPPPEQADAVAALRERLVRLRVDEQLGRYAPALEASASLLEDAKRVGFDPLVADVEHERGLLFAETGAYEEALTAFEQSFAAALRSGYDREIILSGSIALQITAQSTPDPERARMWKTFTEAALDRVGPYTELAGPYWNSVGLEHRLQGRFEEARRAFERSIQIFREADSQGPSAFFALNNLAALEMNERRFEAAERRARELLAAQEEAFGPEHPDLVTTLSTLASALASQNELEEAAAAIDRAIALELEWIGEDSKRLDASRMTLAQVRKRQGDLEGARDLYAQTLASWEKTRGPDDPYTALAHNNLAATLYELGDLEGALQHHERALAVWLAAYGPEHNDVAHGHNSVASDLLVLERCEEATEHLRKAHAVTADLEPTDVLVAAVEGNWAKREMQCGSLDDASRWAEASVEHMEVALGPDHPLVGKMLATAAEVAAARGDQALARTYAERGLKMVDAKTATKTHARLSAVADQLD